MKTSTYQYYGNKMVAVQDLFGTSPFKQKSNYNLKDILPIIT